MATKYENIIIKNNAVCDSDIRRGKNVLLVKLILSVVHYLIFISLSLWILWKSGHRSTMASINWTRWLFALIELNSVCECVCVCVCERQRERELNYSLSQDPIVAFAWSCDLGHHQYGGVVYDWCAGWRQFRQRKPEAGKEGNGRDHRPRAKWCTIAVAMDILAGQVRKL